MIGLVASLSSCGRTVPGLRGDSTNDVVDRSRIADSGPGCLGHERLRQELLRRLEGIEQRLPEDFWRRYDHLISLRKDEALRPDSPEHEELIRMTDEMERCHADRLELLSELARLRGTSLAEVMKHADIAIWNHG
jgi:hypothetical protein